MEEIIKKISGILSLIPLLMPLVKIFNLDNKVIGLENYAARVRVSLKTSFEFIIFFIIATMLLGNYEELTSKIKDDIPHSLHNIDGLGYMYMFVGIIIFIICVIAIAYIHIKLRKIIKNMDKYEKNYLFEKVRVGFYTFVGFMSLGIATINKKMSISIICSIILLIVGIYIFILFRYEADRALLFYYLEDRKVYIYRAIDSDNFLCGTEKNALSCKSYIIKNKDDLLKEELYIVDKKEIKKDGKKDNKKNIKVNRYRQAIVKIFNENTDITNILIFISAISVSVVLYNTGRTCMTDLLIGFLVIGYTVAVELVIICVCHKMLLLIKSLLPQILKKLIKNIKIVITVIYALIFIFRMCCWNKISFIEFTIHLIVLSIVFKSLIYKGRLRRKASK